MYLQENIEIGMCLKTVDLICSQIWLDIQMTIVKVQQNYIIKIAKRHNLTLTELALAFVNDRPFVTSNIIEQQIWSNSRKI